VRRPSGAPADNARAARFALEKPAMPIVLEVEHRTTYRYARPVSFSAHRVSFHPRPAHDIRVLHASLEVTPYSRQRWMHDVFSNSVAVVEPMVPADELQFTARFAIEHHGVKNHELPVADEAKLYPFSYSDDRRIDLSGFLLPQYPDDLPLLRDWTSKFLPQRGRTHTRDVLVNINEAIRSDFGYAARDEMGTQRPAETLRLQTGTCRDFALLMMEAVRSLGLAARFVSGYIYDAALDQAQAPVQPEGQTAADGSWQGHNIASRDIGGTLGSGATHAWLHVYLPGAGWVPFDPTNTLYGGTDLIRVAYTRTPEQAAPVSGSWIGEASDFVSMHVDVKVSRLSAAAADGVASAEPLLPAST
jgi:transglutaminase-like putative cysteine protease